MLHHSASPPSRRSASPGPVPSAFWIGPLDPGFGHQPSGRRCGRTLLSSIPRGRAVTQVRFDESAPTSSRSFPGVKGGNRGSDIILNLKDLGSAERVGHAGNHADRTLRGPGGRERARDLRHDLGRRRFLQHEAHIANGETPRDVLAIDVTVERGKGYAAAGAQARRHPTIGVISGRRDLLAGPRRVAFVVGSPPGWRFSHRLRPDRPWTIGDPTVRCPPREGTRVGRGQHTGGGLLSDSGARPLAR